MPLRDDLLQPIPGANPAGVDLRYEPVYEKLKEARREDEIPPEIGERKVADWAQVTKLAGEALASKSKDLQLAVWLTEAALRREGVAGLTQGLDLLRALLEQYWDTLHPPVDEDGEDDEEKYGLRAGALEALSAFDMQFAVRSVAIDRAGHSLLQYQDAQAVPSETQAAGDEAKAQLRTQKIAEGKLTPEEFERGFAATPKPWYKQLVADLDACLESLLALDELGQQRFGEAYPSYAKLRSSLEELLAVARTLLRRKLELEPDPVEGGEGAGAGDLGAATPAGGGAGSSAGATLAPEPVSRDDAAARVAAAARYLRRTEPQNPAPYLMLRGLRWGELRAGGVAIDPTLLEAPPTAVRTRLKALLLDEKWADLLEACEGVMAASYGRGWLDLQRYAVTACERLGPEFAVVGEAIARALAALLEDLPQLPQQMLMDDTPVGNAETREWLQTRVVLVGGASEDGVLAHRLAGILAARDGDDGDGANGSGAPRALGTVDPHARALAEVRAGRVERAVGILAREVRAARSARERFVRQLQLVEILLDAGHAGVAQPLLDELMPLVEAHRLPDWEELDLLGLTYRCLEKSGADSPLKPLLYLRMCRLDPVRALTLSPATLGDASGWQSGSSEGAPGDGQSGYEDAGYGESA